MRIKRFEPLQKQRVSILNPVELVYPARKHTPSNLLLTVPLRYFYNILQCNVLFCPRVLRYMVLGNFHGRALALIWFIQGPGPAVLALGAGVGFFSSFSLSGRRLGND